MSALYLFYLGTKTKNLQWVYFPISCSLMALSILTRYAGIILMLIYILYPVYIQLSMKKSFWIKDWGYWIGLGLFFIILIPWFQFNQANFGSPIGALFTGIGTVTSNWYIGEWYYYFIHWIEIFGLVGIFAIPGIVALILRRKNQDVFLMLIILFTLSFFMLIPRKEVRYLIHFFHIYFILISIGIVEFKTWINSKKLIPGLAIIFIGMNFIAGIQIIQGDIHSGESLKNAGIWLSINAPVNTTIMSQNIPVLSYTSGKRIVYFPRNKSDLKDKIIKNNVSFIVIESREPTYPEWVWVIDKSGKERVKRPSDFMNNNFMLEKSFQEHNKTYVWVYRISGKNLH
jgi:hypothetical protein